MVDALRRGDQVLTQGGIYGKVTKVKEGEEDIEVEIANNMALLLNATRTSPPPLFLRASCVA